MNSQTTLVSIFICTYNQEAYIEETLDSFLMQECDFNYEIVIAEDQSSDNTLKICQEYARNNKGLINIISRKKNLGLIENFFQGITKCKGKYIAMCGGDDYWVDKNKLQKQANFLESNNDYVITYTDSVMINDNGDEISNTEVGIENLRDFSKPELHKGAFISPRAMMFRNVLDFNEINYSGIFQEDAFLISLLGEYGKGKFLDDINPSVYRILDQGIWSSKNEVERHWFKLSTFKRLESIYDKKKNLVYAKFYQDLRNETIQRVLYLSINSNNLKFAIKAYLKGISSLKNWKSSKFMHTLNKDFFGYIFSRKNG